MADIEMVEVIDHGIELQLKACRLLLDHTWREREDVVVTAARELS